MNKLCPLLKKPCVQDACMLWKPIHFEKAGENAVEWDCSINWNMTLQIELAKQIRGASASMDKAASEIQAGMGTLVVAALKGDERLR